MQIAEPVKRQYRSPRRAEAARATRRAVVDAARELFVRDGYPATTLAAVAERAGVSVQTIYAQFGTKSNVLKEVIDQSVAGDDLPVPIADRDESHRAQAATSGEEFLRLGAALGTAIHRRMAAVDAMIDRAAAVDPDAVVHVERGLDQRRRGAGEMIDLMVARGWLRPGLDHDEATDRLRALMDPALYRLTVSTFGWTPERHQAWIEELAIASLL